MKPDAPERRVLVVEHRVPAAIVMLAALRSRGGDGGKRPAAGA
jgi:hypothetical protein